MQIPWSISLHSRNAPEPDHVTVLKFIEADKGVCFSQFHESKYILHEQNDWIGSNTLRLTCYRQSNHLKSIENIFFFKKIENVVVLSSSKNLNQNDTAFALTLYSSIISVSTSFFSPQKVLFFSPSLQLFTRIGYHIYILPLTDH